MNNWSKHLNPLRNIFNNFKLWLLQRDKDEAYQNYLNIQVKRTLSKIQNTQTRLKKLVDLTMDYINNPPAKSVLCIGCRNTTEIDQFKTYGFEEVIGIDLVSVRSDIKIMDMHDLKFKDNRFDVVFSSHSLEHALDVNQVVREIKRVARPDATIIVEVPIDFVPRGSDLINFENSEGVLEYFSPDVKKVFYQDVVTDDIHGTKATRVIFQI